jgi:hypothetical protein
LLQSKPQTSEAMVLEVVYSDEDMERAKMSANEIWTLLYSERVQATLSDEEEDLEGVTGQKEDVVLSTDDTENENEDKDDGGQDTVRTSEDPLIKEGRTGSKKPVCKEVTAVQQVLLMALTGNFPIAACTILELHLHSFNVPI